MGGDDLCGKADMQGFGRKRPARSVIFVVLLWGMWAAAQLFTASLVLAAQGAKDAGETLPDPSDLLDRLYGRKRLSFEDGAPAVTVRLMEGREEIVLAPVGAASLSAASDTGPGKRALDIAPETALVFRVQNGRPALLRYRVQVGEFRVEDRAGLAQARRLWSSRGLKAGVVRTGSRYGVSGRVIDLRRDLLVVGEALSLESAQKLQKDLLAKFGEAAQLHPVLERRPSGTVVVSDQQGRRRLTADTAAILSPRSEKPLLARQVEFGVGYAFHGFQDRRFRGDLIVAVDARGKLALVNRIDMESYLRGIVPSEIFASAPQEALKAQAVTARGEVLAKIGTRHVGDPYLLCAEQHCQVYSGVTGENTATDKAIRATRGEVLFAKSGELVNSTYSAVCGGHTENNETVWGTLPDPSLRGRPDVGAEAGKKVPDLSDDAALHAFLTAADSGSAFCASSSFSSPAKFRWEKRLTREEVNAMTQDLGIGPVVAMKFSDRGVSGRASVLTLSGLTGARQIRGELNIRRRFGNLNSTMAEVEPPDEHHDDWIFRGGGWGHGVGMCQIGAIGRAEAGQDYRTILRHYFGGASPRVLYGGTPDVPAGGKAAR